MFAKFRGPKGSSKKKQRAAARQRAEEASRRRKAEREERKQPSDPTRKSTLGAAAMGASEADEMSPDAGVRYWQRVEQFLRDGQPLPRARHAAWWFVHNCVAHPLLGVAPGDATVRLHDWTSDRLNGRDAPSRSPRPEIARRGAWLLHNCVVHPLIGLLPRGLAFDLHDASARRMDVPHWV